MMQNLSYFLATLEIFCELSHPQRNLHMFKTPSSPRIYLLSKNKKACLIIADLNSLPAIDAHERQLFIELLARVVSPRIYIR